VASSEDAVMSFSRSRSGVSFVDWGMVLPFVAGRED
jgi:hypothetical protein